jgi:hypothetical protein
MEGFFMNRLCIVQCGRTKIWKREPTSGPVLARNAYTGAFAVLAMKYADRFFTDWVLLSAKHGWLRSDDVVPADYDVSFDSGKPDVMTPEQLRDQLAEKGLNGYDEVVLLGGKKYARVVRAVFGETTDLLLPLQGQKGIGYMLQALKAALADGREL